MFVHPFTVTKKVIIKIAASINSDSENVPKC